MKKLNEYLKKLINDEVSKSTLTHVAEIDKAMKFDNIVFFKGDGIADVESLMLSIALNKANAEKECDVIILTRNADITVRKIADIMATDHSGAGRYDETKFDRYTYEMLVSAICNGINNRIYIEDKSAWDMYDSLSDTHSNKIVVLLKGSLSGDMNQIIGSETLTEYDIAKSNYVNMILSENDPDDNEYVNVKHIDNGIRMNMIRDDKSISSNVTLKHAAEGSVAFREFFN